MADFQVVYLYYHMLEKDGHFDALIDCQAIYILLQQSIKTIEHFFYKTDMVKHKTDSPAIYVNIFIQSAPPSYPPNTHKTITGIYGHFPCWNYYTQNSRVWLSVNPDSPSGNEGQEKYCMWGHPFMVLTTLPWYVKLTLTVLLLGGVGLASVLNLLFIAGKK